MEQKQVYLVGAGLGQKDSLSLAGAKAIEESHLLIGAKRLLVPYEGEKPCLPLLKPEEILEGILSAEAQTIAVLFSGDIGFYSGAKKLIPLLQQQENVTLKLLSGQSTVQYFASQVALPWEDWFLLSAHGRSHNAVGEIQSRAKTFLLTGDNFTPQDLITALVQRGLGEVSLWVGENLSYPEEQITHGRAKDLCGKVFSSLSVVLAENPQPVDFSSPSLPDSAFVRGKVPMTKEEIRVFALSKLSISPWHTLWDVGAGTGSVSVEMAFSANKGQVFVIEEKEEALALLDEQKKKFSLPHLEIVSGSAPQALEDLPMPHGVFVGGSRGNLKEILRLALARNPEVNLVITAITLETLSQATECLGELAVYDLDIVQISVTRTKKVGRYHMMDGQNPVWVISAKGGLR